MARSQNFFNKKEKEKKRLQKRKAKQQRKEERKANAADPTLDNMMAYIDEDGNIVDTPPDETNKEKIDASSIEISVPKKVDEEPSVRTGRVVFFDESKGYGFINEDGTQERFFVHTTGLKEAVAEGDKVNFIGQKGQKGMDAIDVSLAK